MMNILSFYTTLIASILTMDYFTTCINNLSKSIYWQCLKFLVTIEILVEVADNFILDLS